MHPGQGPGLSARELGETGGSDTVALHETEIAAHHHALRANTVHAGDTSAPGPMASFAKSSGGRMYQAAAHTHLAPQALGPTGAGDPHDNLQPYLALNFAIALQGVFPPRP
jgi:microcystin-dependent protein